MRNRLFEESGGDMMGEARLLGLGFDHTDGHKRITKAEQFSVVGGSEQTHERLTETLVKTFEDLDRRGKRLEETDPQELADILQNNTL